MFLVDAYLFILYFVSILESSHSKWACLQVFVFICVLQLKKQKLKEVEKRKAREVEKAKEEQLSKKRQREERRGRYREQDKLNKRIRKNTEG